MTDRKIIRTSLRIPESLQELIISAADSSNRTMNAEIINRLDFAITKNLAPILDPKGKEAIQKTSLRLPVALHDAIIEQDDIGFNAAIIGLLKASFTASPEDQEFMRSMGEQTKPYPLRMEPFMRASFERMAKDGKRSLHAELMLHLSKALEHKPAETQASPSLLPASSTSHPRVIVDDVAYYPATDVIVLQDPTIKAQLQQAMADPIKAKAIATLLKKLAAG